MEYYIDEVRTRALANPATFSVPDLKDIDALRVGDFVKLIFLPKDLPKDQFLRGERMWVEIKEIDGEVYRGELNNDPILVKAKCGDPVTFGAEHVAGIFIPPGGDGERRKVRSNQSGKNQSAH